MTLCRKALTGSTEGYLCNQPTGSCKVQFNPAHNSCSEKDSPFKARRNRSGYHLTCSPNNRSGFRTAEVFPEAPRSIQ
jgi:hypothetical protein